MDSRTLYLGTPTRRLFFMAAVPGAVSMLASSLWQTLDGVFVGQFVGATAFAAINLAMPFVIVNFALADLIGVGSAVPISVALGRGRRDEANSVFTCATILIVLTGLVTGAAMYLGAPTLMSLMGASGEFAELAVGYLRVYALFSPLSSLLYAVDNFLRISGYIRGSMALNVGMSALSMSLELLLLAGLGWDTRGCARSRGAWRCRSAASSATCRSCAGAPRCASAGLGSVPAWCVRSPRAAAPPSSTTWRAA
ncbi:MATE family efflux transporter [Olsenella profusa]|uniref:MatE protein n=1 Tax=Olsenella profusa TaxID=138595 RepID=A0ABS2F2U4_9ACTN|nr:MATE family efflux transporter [Olsenella profusa]MBM6775135.1 hypothetical protein [Olsenella profusa]